MIHLTMLCMGYIAWTVAADGIPKTQVEYGGSILIPTSIFHFPLPAYSSKHETPLPSKLS